MLDDSCETDLTWRAKFSTVGQVFWFEESSYCAGAICFLFYSWYWLLDVITFQFSHIVIQSHLISMLCYFLFSSKQTHIPWSSVAKILQWRFFDVLHFDLDTWELFLDTKPTF